MSIRLGGRFALPCVCLEADKSSRDAAAQYCRTLSHLPACLLSALLRKARACFDILHLPCFPIFFFLSCLFGLVFFLFFQLYFASVHKYLFSWILFFAAPNTKLYKITAGGLLQKKVIIVKQRGVELLLGCRMRGIMRKVLIILRLALLKSTLYPHPSPSLRSRLGVDAVHRLLDCRLFKEVFFYHYFALWGLGTAV